MLKDIFKIRKALDDMGIEDRLNAVENKQVFIPQSVRTINGNLPDDLGNINLTAAAAAVWGDITGTLSNQADLQTALDAKVAKNANITSATKTKITYDAKGLVTAGADATTADIAASTNRNYVTDAQAVVIGNTSGTNTGDQDLSSLAPKASPTFTGTVTVPTPSGDTDAATKAYVDAVKQGLDIKASVRVATTANITLSAAQTIDGVSAIAGDRVLVKNQTTGADNGIYVVAAGSWTRATDADVSSEVTSGMYTFVSEGTTNASTGFVLTTADPITLGTTALVFTQFSGAGQITAGDGLTKTGNTLNVGAGTGISVASDSIAIDTNVTVDKTTAQTLTNKTLTSPVINTPTGIVKGDVGLGNVANVDTTVATITYIIDGGGSAITTGVKGDLEIPFACTITRATLVADQSGSIVVDLWKDTYANYPPTVADTITASAKPTLSAAAKSQDSTLTGWTTSITAGDTIRYNVNSATTVTRVTLSLKVTRT